MDTGCIPPTVNFFQYTSHNLLIYGSQIVNEDMRSKGKDTSHVSIVQSGFECAVSDWSAAILHFILCLCPKFASCRFTREKTIPLPY